MKPCGAAPKPLILSKSTQSYCNPTGDTTNRTNPRSLSYSPIKSHPENKSKPPKTQQYFGKTEAGSAGTQPDRGIARTETTDSVANKVRGHVHNMWACPLHHKNDYRESSAMPKKIQRCTPKIAPTVVSETHSTTKMEPKYDQRVEI